MAAHDEQVEKVELRNCPPGPFLYNGSLGFKTEYGSMECENPHDPKTLWRVGHHSDVYVMASGEAFWGGITSKEDREKLLVVPIDPDALTRAAIAALGDGWPSISPELIDKLNKLATYLTEQGEYEACDLIDTVVERLTPKAKG